MDPTLQLNWLARYVPLLPHLDAEARRSLLEVGPGVRGVGAVIDTPFVGADVVYAGRPRPPMRAIAYEAGGLPFQSGAFHTVVSMDTLEHVPPDARGGFLLELMRVAAARVIVGFPADAAAAEVDRSLMTLVPRLGGGVPEWLHEHEAYGMPDSRAVETVLDGLAGWRRTPLATTGTAACLLLMLADLLPELHRWIGALLETHGDAFSRWIAAASFGPSFRKVHLLERETALTPRVDLTVPATLWAALACPCCGAAGAPFSHDRRVVCAGCDAAFTTDERDVVVLTRARAQRAAAPVVFALEPDWLHATEWVAAVHNYLHAFEPGDACILWLEVDGDRLSAEEALAILQPILASFGGAPFPSVTLSDDRRDRPPAGPLIRLPSAPAELLCWDPERFRAAAAAACDSAGAAAGAPAARPEADP